MNNKLFKALSLLADTQEYGGVTPLSKDIDSKIWSLNNSNLKNETRLDGSGRDFTCKDTKEELEELIFSGEEYLIKKKIAR